MKRYCACRRQIVLTVTNTTRRDVAGHDLCQRCWRALIQHQRAARMQTKPWWAVKRPAFQEFMQP
ncbi:MAG: hypothetical protein HOP32_06975 [Nitrospira sp.]|nr:hypothetical protein [Nitrospira sp.]